MLKSLEETFTEEKLTLEKEKKGVQEALERCYGGARTFYLFLMLIVV